MNSPTNKPERQESAPSYSDPRSSLAGQLIGPHFGLIEELLDVPPEPDDIPVAVYAGRLCRTGAFGLVDVPQEVSGAAVDPPQALAACLGEALERYAAGLPSPTAIRRGRINEFTQRAVPPERFALFSPAQYRQNSFPFRRWTASDELGWTQSVSLTSHEPVWVPACFVWQPYVPGIDEPSLSPSLTTGLACGSTWTDAVAGGLCEVVERDAVALAWLGRIQPARISPVPIQPAQVVTAVPAVSASAAETLPLMDLLNRGGFRWALFDLTSDSGIPTAAAFVEGHSPLGWIFSFGSAAAGDPDRAMSKALIEAIHCRMYVKSLLRDHPQWQAGRNFTSLSSFSDHARFYTNHPEHREPIDHWWASPRKVDWFERHSAGDGSRGGDSAKWLSEQVERLASRGYEVLAVDVTTPDVRDLGLWVVRVLVPGLQPLHGNHGWPHLGGRRLTELSQVFGPHVRQPQVWNPWPHPCP